MHTLLVSPLLARPLSLERSFPPFKRTDGFTNKSYSSYKLSRTEPTLSLNSSHIAVNSRVSANDEICLFSEWAQLLQISVGSGDFLLGLAVHAFLQKLGGQNDAFQGNNLINLYSKFNRLDDAQRVFVEMPVRNAITWTSLMKGHSQVGDVESVFLMARKMLGSGENFNEHTCSVILQACSRPGYRLNGEQIHGYLIKCGFEEDVFVCTSLVSMYSRNGSFNDAEKVFDNMPHKDVRCLNFMISEYGNTGLGENAIESFLELLGAGLEPNDYTFTSVISACSKDLGVEEGMQLHGLAIKHGFVSKTTVGNAIISMYGKHGMVEEAEKIFHRMDKGNLISWTALFSGYVKNGHGQKALGGFLEILKCGVHPDTKCLSVVLDGCSECNNLELGCQIHGVVMKRSYHSDANVATALIDLYAKNRDARSAKLVFDSLSSQTTASFNAILGGFMHMDGDEDGVDAFSLFSQLRLHGMLPDSVTFALLLTLSADQARLLGGKSLHCYAIKTGLESNFTVSNSVIAMYAKCGSVQDAFQMFKGMGCRDSISWNIMISTYALHGQGENAISLFEEMKEQGFAPDEITLLAVLQACNYSGLFNYGISFFENMEQVYGIKPVFEHFACMVDLLGRAGLFSRAIDLIRCSPFSDSPMIWRTLVHACKLHQELGFGVTASKHLLDLLPRESGSYILISNMYARGGMLEEAAKVRTLMNDRKVSKNLGYSWIEINDKVHRFGASSKEHPESKEIYSHLDLLGAEMKWFQNDSTGMELMSNAVYV